MSSRRSNNNGGSGGRPMGSSVCDLIQRAHGFVKNLLTKARHLIDCLKEYYVFTCLSNCFDTAWGCVQLWTPLSVTFIMYWLIYRPDHFHPRIDSAVLAAFDITNNATTTAIPPALRYDLAVDLSFQNSRRMAIRYLDVAASVFYNGSRLGPTDDALPSFYQGPKNTTVRTPPDPTMSYCCYRKKLTCLKLFPANGGTKCWRI